jgi:hypothetical protein
MQEFIQEIILADFIGTRIFDQFWLAIFCLIPLVLIARTIVTGTSYSPVLLIVVFGLSMGYILVKSGVSSPGLPEFQVLEHISRTTVITLAASFFVGGQELRKSFGKAKIEHDDLLIILSDDIVTIGTNRTEFTYIFRAFFILLGIDTTYRIVVGIDSGSYYPLLAFIGLVGSHIIIDHKAITREKKNYIRKGSLELCVIILIMIITFYIAEWIKPVLALPQIFFVMLAACGLGAIFYKWNLGPTIRALLFAGLPIVLAGNFIIGGSMISEVFEIRGMISVLAFGFFGQLLWMFGGISLIIIFAQTSDVRNLAPALAGGLSHAGLTGACTAGDFGTIARIRAPIMINIPFLAHIFVFSILAASAKRGSLSMIPSVIVLIAGIALTVRSLVTLKSAEMAGYEEHKDNREVKSLMMFSLGWQLVALFGSFTLLNTFGMQFEHVAVATASSLSNFGLFSAAQSGMFGTEAAALLPFIFAMPFLVHPFVFFLFGKAMNRGGHMPGLPAFVLAFLGLLGVIFAVFMI